MKTTPIPVRLEGSERRHLRDLKKTTNLSQSQLIRLAVAYALPLFISGKVNPFSLCGEKRLPE